MSTEWSVAYNKLKRWPNHITFRRDRCAVALLHATRTATICGNIKWWITRFRSSLDAEFEYVCVCVIYISVGRREYLPDDDDGETPLYRRNKTIAENEIRDPRHHSFVSWHVPILEYIIYDNQRISGIRGVMRARGWIIDADRAIYRRRSTATRTRGMLRQHSLYHYAYTTSYRKPQTLKSGGSVVAGGNHLVRCYVARSPWTRPSLRRRARASSDGGGGGGDRWLIAHVRFGCCFLIFCLFCIVGVVGI